MHNGLIDCRASSILLYHGHINTGTYKFKEDTLSSYDTYKPEP